MSKITVSNSKRIRVDPKILDKKVVIKEIETKTISDLFINSTYFGLIIEFVGLFTIFYSLNHLHKFSFHFFQSKNNKEIFERLFKNEYGEFDEAENKNNFELINPSKCKSNDEFNTIKYWKLLSKFVYAKHLKGVVVTNNLFNINPKGNEFITKGTGGIIIKIKKLKTLNVIINDLCDLKINGYRQCRICVCIIPINTLKSQSQLEFLKYGKRNAVGTMWGMGDDIKQNKCIDKIQIDIVNDVTIVVQKNNMMLHLPPIMSSDQIKKFSIQFNQKDITLSFNDQDNTIEFGTQHNAFNVLIEFGPNLNAFFRTFTDLNYYTEYHNKMTLNITSNCN